MSPVRMEAAACLGVVAEPRQYAFRLTRNVSDSTLTRELTKAHRAESLERQPETSAKRQWCRGRQAAALMARRNQPGRGSEVHARRSPAGLDRCRWLVLNDRALPAWGLRPRPPAGCCAGLPQPASDRATPAAVSAWAGRWPPTAAPAAWLALAAGGIAWPAVGMGCTAPG